ncbi:MAG: NAD(P)/FAD-dependent oxidoreductase [Clostridia bacterium]|nr:NAD(P)/FAD-dependent oxidoreductase [Clostridia bacterium]
MKVCVIGGGASGCMAAIKIADKGHDVVLYEKNEKIGKKIYITGKGRCNVTNAVTGPEFLSNVVSNPKFVMSSEVRFNSNDTREFFEEHGVKLKIERGNRVFPVSDKSSDIIKALERGLKWRGVEVVLNANVDDVLVVGNQVSGVVVNGKSENFDCVVVATGGKSYASTGSTGDGYKFASKLGHKIVTPVQALVPIILEGSETRSLQGLSLKNVVLFSKFGNKPLYSSEIGEMIFTDSGISGPLVLSMSSYINRCDLTKLQLFIDFKPALNEDMLRVRIDRDIVSLGAKQTSSLMDGLLPKSLVPVFLKRIGINMTKKANQLSNEERERIILTLKNFELKIKDLASFDYAVVTAGGVSVKEVSPKTMESKLVKRLYFVGEVLDVDALTGGFNLQIAFSTAAQCASNF